MRLLLDTNVVIWAVGEPEALSDRAAAALSDSDNDLLISAASVWEIGIKYRKHGFRGAERLAQGFETALDGWDYKALPISTRHVQLAPVLPGPHKDPFDRMLAAQSILEEAVLVTNDAAMDQFGVQRLW